MNKKQLDAAEKRLAELNQENFDLRDKLVPLDARLGELASEIGQLVKRHAEELAELTSKRDAIVKEREEAVSRRADVKAEYSDLYEDVGIAKKELGRKQAVEPE